MAGSVQDAHSSFREKRISITFCFLKNKKPNHSAFFVRAYSLAEQGKSGFSPHYTFHVLSDFPPDWPALYLFISFHSIFLSLDEKKIG